MSLIKFSWAMEMHTCDPSTWKAGAGRSLSLKPCWLQSEFQETTQGDPVWKKSKKKCSFFFHIFIYIATLPSDHGIDVISGLQLAPYVQQYKPAKSTLTIHCSSTVRIIYRWFFISMFLKWLTGSNRNVWVESGVYIFNNDPRKWQY